MRLFNELGLTDLQVTSLQEQQQLLLRYTAQLIREKNVLVQRTLELTERWNMSTAENLQLRSRLQADGSGGGAAGSELDADVPVLAMDAPAEQSEQ